MSYEREQLYFNILFGDNTLNPDSPKTVEESYVSFVFKRLLLKGNFNPETLILGISSKSIIILKTKIR